MYSVDQIVEAFTPGSPTFVSAAIALVIAMTFGLLEYAWATKLSREEGKTPFPVWMHSFMLAHDLTAGCFMVYWGVQYHFFWYFMLQGIGMLAWMCLELTNIRTAIKNETEETWGTGISQKQSTIYMVLMTLVMLAFVNIMRYLMNGTAMFLWLPMTNFVMAVAPGYIL